MKILVIKLSSLGDLFCALPVVHNLKVALNAQIDWVTQDEYVELVKCFTPVDRVIPFHRKAFFSGLLAFIQDLRTFEYDYIVDLQGLLKSAVVARLARGKWRIGPSFSREGACLFYDAEAGKRNKNRHAVEESLDVVRFLKREVIEPEFPTKFPAVKLEGKRPRVAILPGSRWQTKTWPTGRFAQVAKRLADEKNASIFLLGGSADIEICKQIHGAIGGNTVNMAGKTSLPEMGGILKQMDLVISNDSGPAHMAAAARTPVLVMFGPTDPARTGPYGVGHRVIKTMLPCQPCFSRACRYDSVKCMDELTVDTVCAAALDMLKSRK